MFMNFLFDGFISLKRLIEIAQKRKCNLNRGRRKNPSKQGLAGFLLGMNTLCFLG